MTIENAKKMLPIIQAFTEGKTVECYDGEKWIIGECLDFDGEPENYRIKREPKYRQFVDCDELIQFWESHYGNSNRPKGTMPLIWVKRDVYSYLVTGFDFNCDEVLINKDWYEMIDLFKVFTFLDGKPCGIEVTE